MIDTILLGDCMDRLAEVPADSVDLIVTSPPYSDQRKANYGGVKPEQYVEWFLPRSEQMIRVLKPEGSFILNIKEKAVNGERSTYVLELILALRAQGWLWAEEYIWHKRNSYPGKWPNRFRDAWERLLHFTRQRHFRMYQDEVMIPAAPETVKRAARVSPRDTTRQRSGNGSKFGSRRAYWADRPMVYPTNVLTLAPANIPTGHSAAYPVELPSWFIRLFTQPGDLVLDPFMGSGTTAVAAKALGRHYLGVELLPEHITLAEARIAAQAFGTPDQVLVQHDIADNQQTMPAQAAPQFTQLTLI